MTRDDQPLPDGPRTGDANPPVHVPAGVGSRFARLGRLVRKELTEVLRDRRTILTLVLMPLLVYPILTVAFQQLLLAGVGSTPEIEYRLGFPTEAEGNWLGRYLRLPMAPDEPPAARPRPAEKRARMDPRFRAFAVPDLEAAVQAGAIDLGLRQVRGELGDERGFRDLALDWELVYLEDSSRAQEALAIIEGRCVAANAQFLETRLRRLRITQRAVPVQVRRTPLKSPERGGQISLAGLVPLILVLMTITGAVYPAIDLTAGERERGTLEVLVAAPIPRMGLLFAKYVSVLTVALLTAVVNLGTMLVTLWASGIGPVVFRGGTLSAGVILQVFLLLLLFAAFFSAVLLTITSFARSFKEAQAYLIPLMLVSLGPAMLGMMPGLKLSGPLCVVPLINIVLLARDLLEGQAEAVLAIVVVLSTLFYAVAALTLAARVFGAEAVLYSEQGAWSDLFRRPAEPRSVPALGNALFCLAALFPAHFLVNAMIARWPAGSITDRLLLGALAQITLFAGFPLVAAWLGRVRLKQGFLVRWPGWLPFLGASLLGLTLWPFAHEVVIALRSLGLATLPQEQLERVRELVEEWRQASPLWVVLVMAVGPAVFEELFFRGYLFHALSVHTRPRTALFTSALLFGLFHLLLADAVAVERLVSSTLMGVVLAWVCWRTGSVLPGMALHACHNGFLVLASYYQTELARLGVGTDAQTHVPLLWLAGALVGASLGAGLLLRRQRIADSR